MCNYAGAQHMDHAVHIMERDVLLNSVTMTSWCTIRPQDGAVQLVFYAKMCTSGVPIFLLLCYC